MWQPNAPTQPGPPNYVHRLPPIPTTNRHEAPPLRPQHSDGTAVSPPVPARPVEQVIRPSTSQGIAHHTVTASPFPVPPPPPPLPPRIHQTGNSTMALQPPMLTGGAHGGYVNHSLSRPLSQMNLNGMSGPYNNMAWMEEERRRRDEEMRAMEQTRRLQQEEEARKAVEVENERIRLENERLAELERIKKEQEERAREEALRRQWEEELLRRQKREEEERERERELLRQREEEEKRAQEEALRKELEEEEKRAREEALRKQWEEEEKRAREEAREEALRKQWEEEERLRREEWEEEERQRVEAQRAQWVAEEMERTERMRREMEDEKFAAVESVREQMEAERLKKEQEDRLKVSEEVARAEAERLKAIEERDRKARLLQEDQDAEMARLMAQSEEEDEERPTTPIGHPGASTRTPPRPSVDLPGYEPLDRSQAVTPVPAPQPPASTHSRTPSLSRPHANTVHGPIMQIPFATMPEPQHYNGPPLNTNNMHIQPTLHPPVSTPNRHSVIIPPERQGSPNQAHAPNHPGPNVLQSHPGSPDHVFPPNHPGFPGPGNAAPYRNQLAPPEVSPSQSPAPNARPNRLVRQSVSLGGANPGRQPAHVNARPQPGPIAMPPHRVGAPPGHMPPAGHVSPNHAHAASPPGHVGGSASMSHVPSGTPKSSGRPSTAQGPFSPSELDSSPGSGSSTQPVASGSSSTGIASTSSYSQPYRGPSEPLAGIVHGFGRPVIRHQDLPAATSLQDVIVMEPEPSPPFHIVSHTWKHLLKFIASQSTCRIEPSPAALAREKSGPPNLRVVMHFVKLPVATAEWRIVLYFAVQSITPPPEHYPKHDTSVVPYLFPSPEPGRPLANNPDTQIFTVLTEPLPVLPLSLPHLAPYLQAALEESQRSSDSRSRLHKLVNATINAANASTHTTMTPIIGPIVNAMSSNKSELEAPGPPIGVAGASGQRRNFISKMFRPKASGSKGKGLNNEMFDVVTPFHMEYQ